MIKRRSNLQTLWILVSVFFIWNTALSQETQPQPFDTLAGSVKILNEEMGKLKKIKFSGYIQGQYQYCDSNGIKTVAGGDFPVNNDKRFMLRRARLKAVYSGNYTEYVFQIDATEKSFSIKDMYVKVTEPWLNTVSLSLGNQNRPFGYEIGFSSSSRESPERGRLSQTIFNGERDLGAMLTIQAPKTSRLNMLKLEAGLFNGTGGTEFDKRKDLIAHLSFNKSNVKENINVGGGVSYYNGGWVQGSKKIWEYGLVKDSLKGFIMRDTLSDKSQVGRFTERKHYGADLQINLDLPVGFTTLRAEYIYGTQSAVSGDTKTPSSAPLDKSGKPADIYLRSFNGAYFYFIYNVYRTKVQLIAKYDWYDPNVNVSGNDIGGNGSKLNNLTSADIKYNTLGLGLAYKWDQNVKFSVYYDMVKNETTSLKGYSKDLPDNVLTVRMQYKF